MLGTRRYGVYLHQGAIYPSKSKCESAMEPNVCVALCGECAERENKFQQLLYTTCSLQLAHRSCQRSGRLHSDAGRANILNRSHQQVHNDRDRLFVNNCIIVAARPSRCPDVGQRLVASEWLAAALYGRLYVRRG